MKSIGILIILLLGLFTFNIFADDPQPQATVRLEKDCLDIGGAENLQPMEIKNRCYMVEIYMPESLNRVCHNSSGDEIECPIPNFATLFNGKTLSNTTYPVEISPNDASIAQNSRNRIFAIYLPSNFSIAKLQVMFDPYNSTKGLFKFPTTSVTTDNKVDFSFDSNNKIIVQKIALNQLPIKCVLLWAE